MPKIRKKLGLTHEKAKLKYPEEKYQYTKKIDKLIIPYMVLCSTFSYVFLALVLNDTIDLSQYIRYKTEDLPDPRSQLGFLLKFWAVASLWLILWKLICILFKEYGPSIFSSNVLEYLIRKWENILLISTEQFFQTFAVQLVLVSFLSAELTLKYIPALHFLFILGRAQCWLDPFQQWTMGFVISVAPSMFVLFYISYKFVGLFMCLFLILFFSICYIIILFEFYVVLNNLDVFNFCLPNLRPFPFLK